MSKKDYYDILGLTTACTTQDVKRNYHKLALVWHPDKHANKSEAQKKFTEINEAYSILVDANKRQLYDRYGHQGLGEDSRLDGFGGPHNKNFFHEKGFAGTDKSAFEFLQDIFAENEEDDFLQSFDPFKISDTFQRTFKGFMEESSDDDEDDSFFKSYIPTFMDNSFFSSPPPLFQSFFAPEHTESQTQFFSFFTSMDSNTQSFSKTSSMFVNNGKVQTSTKQRMQKGDTVIENEENNEYMKQAHSLLFGNSADSKSRNLKSGKDKKDSDIIIIEDNESPVNQKSQPKKSKKPGKKENNSQAENQEFKKACRFFDFDSLSEDDERDFDILGGNGLNFRKKCAKKAKI